MSELFVGAMWAAMAARIVLVAYWHVQATRLEPVMKELRQGIAPAMLAIRALGLMAVVVVMLVLVTLAPPVSARSLPAQESGGSVGLDRNVVAEVHDGISLDEAVSRAERQYRARVVRTDVQDEDGRKIYVLKLLSEDGRVFTVRIDAATGGMR